MKKQSNPPPPSIECKPKPPPRPPRPPCNSALVANAENIIRTVNKMKKQLHKCDRDSNFISSLDHIEYIAQVIMYEAGIFNASRPRPNNT